MKKTALCLMVVLFCMLCLAAQAEDAGFPQLAQDPVVGEWYSLSDTAMKDSEGGSYHAFFRKGSENKVLVYFAGGGVSVNEVTARCDTYNTVQVQPDALSLLTMNMGGLAFPMDGNPFKDWSMILFPYATGDFHCGAGSFPYIDKDGSEKILYHNGYINFTAAMAQVQLLAGVENADAVFVTGYSAGGWAASLLADDVFGTYFSQAVSKTLLVDSSLALYDKWPEVAENVWHAPAHIAARAQSSNIMLDMLTALNDKYGDAVHLLFDCSTRDGSLAQIQAYFQSGRIDEATGEMPVTEADGDRFQETLKQFVTDAKAQANVYFYIFDGKAWYDSTSNLTSHTVIAVSEVFLPQGGNPISIAQWVMDAMNGNPQDCGTALLEKVYPSMQE